MTTAPLAILTLLAPLAVPGPTPGPEPGAREVEWRAGPLPPVLAEARARDAPVFAYFWAASSAQCANLWKDSLTGAPVQSELETFVCFAVDIAQPDAARLLERYHVTTLPTMLVLLPDGRADDALIGYHDPDLLLSDLRRIRRGVDTVTDRRRASEAAPDDLALRFDLAAKLQHVGALDESRELFDSILRDDPRGTTEVGARLRLWDVQKAIEAAAPDPTDLSTFDLAPLYAFLRGVGPAPVAFEGWTWAVGVERERGEREKSVRAMREAWTLVPDDRRLRWGVTTAMYHWEARNEVDAATKALVLEIAEACVAIREAQFESAERAGAAPEEIDVEPLDALALCLLMNARAADALATIEASIERNGATAERAQWRGLIRAEDP